MLIIENFIPNLPYNTRGLYFVPLRTDYSKILYLFSRDQSLVPGKKKEFNKGKKNRGNHIKNYSKKEKEKKTIFRIMKTLKPDVYELYLKEGDNLVKQGNALGHTIETSHKILEIFKDKDPMDEIKVECKLNLNFNKWVPICLSNNEITSVYDL